jgi:hypothetical protein
MNLSKLKPIAAILVTSLIAFIIHSILFKLLQKPTIENSFYYSNIELYTFYTVSSIVLIITLIIIKEKNIDNVGFTFLLLTFIKMGIAYVFLTKIIDNASRYLPKEKINFFIIFAIFLTIETVVTIRILNKNQ